MDALKFNYLIKKIKYDKKAADSIWDVFYPRLKAHVQRRFGKLIESEDVAQDIFLKLLEIEMRDYIQYPTAWLFKMADNHVINTLRGQHTEEELLEIASAEFNIENTILSMELMRAISNLDKISQQILYLHYWEGYSFKELAIELNLSYANIRTKASRAYKTLKKYL